MFNPLNGIEQDFHPHIKNDEIDGLEGSGDVKSCADESSDTKKIIPTSSEEELTELDFTSDSDDEQTTIVSIKRDEDGRISEFIVKNQDGEKITIFYDGVYTKYTEIEDSNGKRILDSLNRIINKNSIEGKNTEYTYFEETAILQRMIEKYSNGNIIVYENGIKTTNFVNGGINVEKDGTTINISNIINAIKNPPLNNKEDEAASKAKEIASKLKDIMYGEENDRCDRIYVFILNEASGVDFDLVAQEYKNLTGGRELNEDLEIVYKHYSYKKDMLDKLISSGGQSPEIKNGAKETASKLKDIIYSKDKNRCDQIYALLASEADAVNFDLIVEEYKNLTGGRELNEDLEIVYKGHPFKKNNLNKLLKPMQSFENSNSQVKNDYYTGDKYKVERQGSIFTITNKNTNEIRRIDLRVLLKNYTNSEDRRLLIEKLQQLPGEVLMDMATEQTSLMPCTSGEEITVEGGKSCNAAAYYSPGPDEIHVDPNNSIQTIIHETGHSVDYNKVSEQNRSSVQSDEKFMEIFNSEMQNYLAAGKKRYEYGAEPPSPSNTYATANEREMFAECYTLLMTGSNKSSEVILKYFPKTLEYIKSSIAKNRRQDNDIRH